MLASALLFAFLYPSPASTPGDADVSLSIEPLQLHTAVARYE